jgi:hypothetical protein
MFLTPDELADLTGLKRPTAQYAWLRANGWPVERDAAGRPKVLRAVVEARMGACVGGTMKVEPNFGALRGTQQA